MERCDWIHLQITKYYLAYINIVSSQFFTKATAIVNPITIGEHLCACDITVWVFPIPYINQSIKHIFPLVNGVLVAAPDYTGCCTGLAVPG